MEDNHESVKVGVRSHSAVIAVPVSRLPTVVSVAASRARRWHCVPEPVLSPPAYNLIKMTATSFSCVII